MTKAPAFNGPMCCLLNSSVKIKLYKYALTKRGGQKNEAEEANISVEFFEQQQLL